MEKPVMISILDACRVMAAFQCWLYRASEAKLTLWITHQNCYRNKRQNPHTICFGELRAPEMQIGTCLCIECWGDVHFSNPGWLVSSRSNNFNLFSHRSISMAQLPDTVWQPRGTHAWAILSQRWFRSGAPATTGFSCSAWRRWE